MRRPEPARRGTVLVTGAAGTLGRVLVARLLGAGWRVFGADLAMAAAVPEVDLVHCPFLPLARTHPEVVCAVHRGLMRGTLEVFGEDDVELSLTPFVEPHRCLAHMTTRTPFAPTRGART